MSKRGEEQVSVFLTETSASLYEIGWHKHGLH